MHILSSKALELSSSQLEELKKENIEISFTPFIQTTAISGPVEWPDTEWIFFSSRNSYLFSIEKGCPIERYKVAAVGSQTASIIHSPIEYIGATSDTKTVGEALKKQIGNASILFPVSSISLLTVADCFEEKQKRILQIYRTQHVAAIANFHQGAIFSSPSNVEGYQLKNSIDANMPVISFGPSTTKACYSAGFKNIITLNEINSENLVHTIISTFGRL